MTVKGVKSSNVLVMKSFRSCPEKPLTKALPLCMPDKHLSAQNAAKSAWRRAMAWCTDYHTQECSLLLRSYRSFIVTVVNTPSAEECSKDNASHKLLCC